MSVTIGTNFLTAKTARYTQFHDAAISETLAHQNEVAVYCCPHTVIPANTSITVNRKMGAQNGFLVSNQQKHSQGEYSSQPQLNNLTTATGNPTLILFRLFWVKIISLGYPTGHFGSAIVIAGTVITAFLYFMGA